MTKGISKLSLALAATLILGVAAFAQDKVEQKVSFYLDGKVGDEVVKKGVYNLTIPEKNEGTVEIKVGKKTISAPFTKRVNQESADSDKMTYRENSDGTRSIATITPRGRKFTLVLNAEGSVAKQ